MRLKSAVSLLLGALLAAACTTGPADTESLGNMNTLDVPPLTLPDPVTGEGSLVQAIDERHSVRNFAAEPLSAEQVSTLLWAAHGHRSDNGRTVPAAGGIYALTIFIAVREAVDLDPGVYVWKPESNELQRTVSGSVASDLQQGAFGQRSVGTAPVVFGIAGSAEEVAQKYGPKAEQFVFNEVGHAAQNLLLMATSLGLGAVPMGGFSEEAVADVLQLPKGLQPYYLIPVGVPA